MLIENNCTASEVEVTPKNWNTNSASTKKLVSLFQKDTVFKHYYFCQ